MELVSEYLLTYIGAGRHTGDIYSRCMGLGDVTILYRCDINVMTIL